jgi:high affinity Mn2+ porin
MKRIIFWSLLLLTEHCVGQIPIILDSAKNLNTDFHFQLTTVTQRKFAMNAPYTGANSLSGDDEAETTMTATIFWGAHLWKGAELYYNPEIAGGAGISSAKGIAGFSNGEAFRVGNPAPVIYTARVYFRQTFSLGGEIEKIPETANQVTKERTAKYFSFTLGKFSIADFFDNNRFSHDPRSQFFNWALMSNGAWDYPANTRGYTWGGVLELGMPKWKIRFASVMVPTTANGNEMDMNFSQANSNVLEVEKPYSIGARKGVIRAQGFLTNAYMGNYDLSVQQNPTAPDITATRAYGRTKYGWGVNIEQEVSEYAGLFARVSWNDGQNETWAFTEIDQSVSAGVLLDGTLWKRERDAIGFAALANGISTPHTNYLGTGGYGFIIGDGKINYGREIIAEAYYKVNLFYEGFWLTADYQFVANPAYNKDRGPANIISLRAHIEL